MNLEKLLERIDLIELAEKAGAKFTHPNSKDARSKCPIHNGDNPTAFSVYEGEEGYPLWYCHTGCNRGGNAIQFYMEWKGVAFDEAITDLAREFSIPLEDIGWNEPRDIAAEKKRQSVKEVLTAAAWYFHRRLISHPGRSALEYALKRGFTRQTIRAARFGFTTGDTGLRNHLIEMGADLDLAKEIGLVRADGLDFTANGNGRAASPDGWLVYPHWIGERCGYFSSRAITPKERMPDPNDKARNLPGERQLYRAEVKGQRGEVTLVEGPADARSLWQVGKSAWALCGLGSLPDGDLARLRRRVVFLATDGDKAGKRAVDDGKVAKAATCLGPLTMLLPEPPKGKDFNAWLQEGLTGEALGAHYAKAATWIERRLEQAAACPPNELDKRMKEIVELLVDLPEGSRPRYFAKARDLLGLTRSEIYDLIHKAIQSNGFGQILASIKDGRLCFLGEPLGNFAAWITHELTRDNGLDTPVVEYTLAGRLADGQPLPTITIPADQFAGMDWIARYWGAKVILYVPKGKTYLVARAIQEISLTELTQEKVFTHTGWREIGGKRGYLSGSGYLSADGLNESVRVDLGCGELHRYALPTPPSGKALADAVRASLDFLNLGPRYVTAPLWAAMYASVFTEVRALYTVLWVYGSTQSGKSTISHLALTHFGSGFISGRQYHSPENWESSLTALEGSMFTAKDAPLIIDDYAPQFVSAYEAQEMKKNAQKVVRRAGNRTARNRSRSNLTQQVYRPPRGLVIVTAENSLPGESTTGRMLTIPVAQGEVLPLKGEPQREPLDRAQKLAGAGSYAQAMSAFLQWLAANWSRAEAKFLEVIEASHLLARGEDVQNRLPDYFAILDAAQQVTLGAFYEMGVLSASEAADIAHQNEQAILGVVVSQAERIAAESPVRKFFEALDSLLERQKVYLAPKTKKVIFTPPLNAELIGYFDPSSDKVVYLNDDVCLTSVREYWAKLGENFDTTQDALRRQFAQMTGILAERGKKNIAVSTWIASMSCNSRVLAVSAERVSELYDVTLRNRGMTPTREPLEDEEEDEGDANEG